jgi:O-antigen/teichoic acid export membrane protein
MKAIILYGFVLFFTKAMAVITIPMVTSAIAPAEFGKLELIVSIVECAALIAGLAIAESFNRATTLLKRRQMAGAALITTGFMLSLFQMAAWYFQSENPLWLHLSLVTAALTAMVELPLANLRSENRARFFAIILITRALLQVTLQYILLAKGYGISGILFANMIVEIGVSLFLTLHFAKYFGFSFSKSAFKDILQVSFPYVLGGLAMFAVGNADRWFILRYVTFEEIAFYGIAIKLSLFVALASHAFNMWWGPRKYVIYDGENGANRVQNILILGFLFNISGAVFVFIAAPLFISYVLPQSYGQASLYIPLLIVVSLLNETATLMSLGAYRAKTGLPVLIINGTGALVALAGYMIFIPQFGIKGAIYATIIAHILRIVLYVLECRRVTPLPIMSRTLKNACHS